MLSSLTPRLIAARVCIAACVYTTIAVWAGWWGLPIWLMFITIPAYAGVLWFFRKDFVDLFVGLRAQLIVAREALSWEPTDEMLDMTSKQLIVDVLRRQAIRKQEVIEAINNGTWNRGK